jgi:hypothetical protein
MAEIINNQSVPSNEAQIAKILGLPDVNDGASESEMRSAIEGAFSKLDEKESEVVSGKMSIDNRIKSLKIEFLNRLFKMLIDMGVNPGDPSSMQKFLSDLERQDPDLVVLFESLLDGMDPEGSRKPVAEMSDQPGLTINGANVNIPKAPTELPPATTPMMPPNMKVPPTM